MIKVITGKPGSGKSYWATRYAVGQMKKGRRVYSNIRINFNYKNKTFTNYKLDKNMIKNLKFPKDSLLIVDEAGFWFNSREFKKFDIEDFQFFSQHRHLNIDIILIVQNMHRIDKSLRELSDEILVCSSLFGIIFRQMLAHGMEDYEKDNFVFKRLYLLRKKYVQAYNTNQCLENFNDRIDNSKLHQFDDDNEITYKEFLRNIFSNNYNKDLIDEYTKNLTDEEKRLLLQKFLKKLSN
jgi:hypothetical protein